MTLRSFVFRIASVAVWALWAFCVAMVVSLAATIALKLSGL